MSTNPPGVPPEDDDEGPVPAPPATRDRELWVGIFFILGLVATVTALFVLTDAALFRGRYIISTTVPNAGGIRKGDPVQMKGVNVGRVMRFFIAPHGVEIRLEIEGEYPVPKDSHVELKSSGLLGGMVADIKPGDSKEMLRGGDRIPGTTEAAMMDTANRLAGEAEKIMKQVELLLSRENIDNVGASTAELRTLLGRLSGLAAEQRQELAALTGSLRKSSTGLEQITADVQALTSRPELQQTVTRLDAAMTRIDAMVARLDETTVALDRSVKSLDTVAARMDRGEGTLGKLSRDPALYDSLNEAAQSITRLTEDIRKQPKRYIDLKVF